MIDIWFESHSTSVDNEAGIASGHSDAILSVRGERQAAEVGIRYPHVTTVWCSDLQRSYRTAEIAFGDRSAIRRDARLREVDFGHFTRSQSAEIEATRAWYVDTPYPNGESYRLVCDRVATFLQELPKGHAPYLIIGHRATWYALEHLLKGYDLVEVVKAPWQWRPGWHYRAVFS
jgi:broad specificity phosphatase PhoE